MIDCRDISDKDLLFRLRLAAAAWFSNNQLLLLEELIRRFESKPGRIIETDSDFDEHDDAMEPLGSHNWEPGTHE